MKHLPKSTPTEILNDPYGFTYKEMSEVIGEDKARALYTELYKQPFHKENLSISTKKVYKSSDTCIFRKNCASVPEERSAIPLQTEQSSAG